jgi:hypothetical protein
LKKCFSYPELGVVDVVEDPLVVDPVEPVVDPAELVVDPAEPVVDPAEPVVDPAEPVVDPTAVVVLPPAPEVVPEALVVPAEFEALNVVPEVGQVHCDAVVDEPLTVVVEPDPVVVELLPVVVEPLPVVELNGLDVVLPMELVEPPVITDEQPQNEENDIMMLACNE